MGLCVRLVRGLVVAGCVLGGVALAIAAGAVTGASVAIAQTASSIVVEGNRRVDNDTIRSYFHSAGGGRLDPASIDAGLKALYGAIARYVFDVGAWKNCACVIFHGASGQPGSPHYTDQHKAWAELRLVPMLYDWKTITAEGDHLELVP